jgi:hypothetical protein
MNLNWPYYVAIAATLALLGTTVTIFTTLLPKDSAQNTRLLGMVSAFSFAASLTAYFIGIYYFSHNPGQMLQFLLMMTMLVLLPASLISVSVSTITISNLRDTLAAGN